MTDKELRRKRAEAGRKGGLKGGKAKTEKTKLRGFAAMSPEKRRELGRKGGKSRAGDVDGMNYETLGKEK